MMSNMDVYMVVAWLRSTECGCELGSIGVCRMTMQRRLRSRYYSSVESLEGVFRIEHGVKAPSCQDHATGLMKSVLAPSLSSWAIGWFSLVLVD